MENQQPTNQEILEAINVFSSHVDQRFDNLEGRVSKIENKVGTIENKINGIENTMVTKIYLDDKLADLRGDLVVLVRKEDKKLAATLDLLVEKCLISRDEAAVVLALEPFPVSR